MKLHDGPSYWPSSIAGSRPVSAKFTFGTYSREPRVTFELEVNVPLTGAGGVFAPL